MCNYCNAQNQRDQIPIATTEIDFGVLGRSIMSMYLKTRKGGTFLDLSLDNYGLGSGNVRKVMLINYCPMCGAEYRRNDHD